VNDFKDYLDKFGSNFLVAAMIPSLGLVIACLVVFDPILRVSAAFQIKNGIYSVLGIGVLVLVPTVLVGFTLTALNTFILKFYEGYVLLHRFRFMRSYQEKQAAKLLGECDLLKVEIKKLKRKRKRTPTEDLTLEALQDAYYAKVTEYDKQYPPPHVEFMPTRFGNILKASEAYSGTRYGIDAVQFWPRLWHVIPPSYQQTIEEARNELSFLVNMSALSLLFYGFCVLAILANAPSPLSPIPPDWAKIFDNSVRYILAAGLALTTNWFFNRAAIFSVGDFGFMIRSAYDLFRLDLLEQFRLKHPKNSIEEFKIWRNLGQLIALGQDAMEYKPLEYVVKKRAPS
jgi:hypothetical protein